MYADHEVFNAYIWGTENRFKVANAFNVDPIRLLDAKFLSTVFPLDGRVRFVEVCSQQVYGWDMFTQQYFTEKIKSIKTRFNFSKEHLKVAKRFKIKPFRLLPPTSQFRDGSYRYLDLCSGQVFGYHTLSRKYFKERLTDRTARLWQPMTY